MYTTVFFNFLKFYFIYLFFSGADQAKFEKPQSMDACSSVSNIHSSTPQTTFVYQESNKGQYFL